MRSAVLATALLMVATLALAACGMMVPPVPNGPQSWGRGEPYRTVYNATVRGCAEGKWVDAKAVKLDKDAIKNMTYSQMEELVKAGFQPWTGEFLTPQQQVQGASLKPTRVERVTIGSGLTTGKTRNNKGQEIQLQCLQTTGTSITRMPVKREKDPQGSWFSNFFKIPESQEQTARIVITACARTSATEKSGWILDHIKVEPQKEKGDN